METILCEFPTFLHILGVKLLTGFVLDSIYALYIYLCSKLPQSARVRKCLLSEWWKGMLTDRNSLIPLLSCQPGS